MFGCYSCLDTSRPRRCSKWVVLSPHEHERSSPVTRSLATYLTKTQAEASLLVTNVTKEPESSSILVDSKPAREGISCHVRQCTWKSVGKLETEDGTFYTATYCVPRLF